jgi:hypothetical protein
MPKKNPAAVSLGRKGGSQRSAAKTAAARANGKLGGRPPQPSNVRLARIRNRIAKGKPITAVEAALHYGDEMGVKKALAWALVRWTDAPPHTIERKWWDDVVGSLERAR